MSNPLNDRLLDKMFNDMKSFSIPYPTKEDKLTLQKKLLEGFKKIFDTIVECYYYCIKWKTKQLIYYEKYTNPSIIHLKV